MKTIPVRSISVRSINAVALAVIFICFAIFSIQAGSVSAADRPEASVVFYVQ